MNNRQTRLFRIVAVTVAIAALPAPAAGFAGSDGKSGGTDSLEFVNRTLRSDIAHPGTSSGLPRTVGQSTGPQSPAPIVVRVDGGFDWAAAGVGAVGGLGLVLVVGGAASAVWSRQRAGLIGLLRKGV